MAKPSAAQAALYEAIDALEVAQVKKLLGAGVDPNFVVHRATPLVHLGIAIWNSRTGLPRKDSAQTKKQRALAELLIEHGAALEFASAAMLGKRDFVEAALAADPSLAKSKLKLNGHSVQLMAAWCGASEIASLLKTAQKPVRKA